MSIQLEENTLWSTMSDLTGPEKDLIYAIIERAIWDYQTGRSWGRQPGDTATRSAMNSRRYRVDKREALRRDAAEYLFGSDSLLYRHLEMLSERPTELLRAIQTLREDDGYDIR